MERVLACLSTALSPPPKPLSHWVLGPSNFPLEALQVCWGAWEGTGRKCDGQDHSKPWLLLCVAGASHAHGGHGSGAGPASQRIVCRESREISYHPCPHRGCIWDAYLCNTCRWILFRIFHICNLLQTLSNRRVSVRACQLLLSFIPTSSNIIFKNPLL